jgi:fucose 4-O-acetylase-like acetyltransferase
MFIYVFHMPMFTLISGYLSKRDSDIYSIKKHVYRILLPFIVFQLIFITIQYAYDTGPITAKGLLRSVLTPEYALWYLFCLFCWRLVLPYFMKLRNPVALSIVIGLLGGLLPKYGLVFSSSRMLAFFPFFILGYYMKTNVLFSDTFINSSKTKSLISLSLIIMVCAVICSIILNGRHQSLFRHNQLYDETNIPIWICMLCRMATYVTAITAGFAFMYIIPKSKSIISTIGQRSMYVYLLHSLLLYPLGCSKILMTISNVYCFCVITSLGIPLTILLSSDAVANATKMLVEPCSIFNRTDRVPLMLNR